MDKYVTNACGVSKKNELLKILLLMDYNSQKFWNASHRKWCFTFEESKEKSSNIIIIHIIHSPSVNWVLILPSHNHNPRSKYLYRSKARTSA